jgi:Pyruvate/2-oxoacid:ferredoxin oxidoreductase delta subunit
MNDVAAVTWPAADGPERAMRRQVALVDVSRCLAWSGTDCRMCYLHCPLRDEAIALDDGRPLVMASACNGCGVCVEACRTVNDVGAIHIVTI